jgi:hypothetical protein
MDYPDADPGLYLDLSRDLLSYQISSADAIDAKTGTWFAIGSTLMGLLVAVIAFRHPHSALSDWLAALATLAYLAMTASTLPTLFAAEWKIGPQVNALLRDRKAGKWTDPQTRWAAVHTIRDDYLCNKTPYRWRLRRMRAVAISLSCQTLLLAGLAWTLVHG